MRAPPLVCYAERRIKLDHVNSPSVPYFFIYNYASYHHATLAMNESTTPGATAAVDNIDGLTGVLKQRLSQCVCNIGEETVEI